MPVLSALSRIISDEIHALGPMPFHRFMELALYHSEHGYYAAGKARIGRHGDFFTNVSVGPVFGRLIGFQFEQMWDHLGNPPTFTVVEQGANNGEFACDFLSSVTKRNRKFADAIEYRIVEPFRRLRKNQQKTLSPFDRISFHASLEDLPPFTGVHFSNELIDAFPVHRLHSNGFRWLVQYVTIENEQLTFVEGPPSELAKLPEVRPAGFLTEVCPDAKAWICSISDRLLRGYVLAFDYGHARADYYGSGRPAGTLSAYREHRRVSNPLENPGETDLTAHVEFTSIVETAQNAGLQLSGFTDQHHFMVGLVRKAFPDCTSAPSSGQQKELRAFATLMHPGLMGQNFKVLCLSRGLEDSPPLAGFGFGGNPSTALGLE
jgi:SAM-dependent MidA family methyltransferase